MIIKKEKLPDFLIVEFDFKLAFYKFSQFQNFPVTMFIAPIEKEISWIFSIMISCQNFQYVKDTFCRSCITILHLDGYFSFRRRSLEIFDDPVFYWLIKLLGILSDRSASYKESSFRQMNSGSKYLVKNKEIWTIFKRVRKMQNLVKL